MFNGSIRLKEAHADAQAAIRKRRKKQTPATAEAVNAAIDVLIATAQEEKIEQMIPSDPNAPQ